MNDFSRSYSRQKPKTINCAITTKVFRKRDGGEGSCGIFSFRDGNKSYTIQITTADGSKTTKRGRPITGWAQVAQFVDNNNASGSW